MDCLFCKIIAGEIPCSKVYEDDSVFAFNDIDPQAPVHVLIVPKEHIASADDVNESNSAVIAHIFEVAAKIAKLHSPTSSPQPSMGVVGTKADNKIGVYVPAIRK